MKNSLRILLLNLFIFFIFSRIYTQEKMLTPSLQLVNKDKNVAVSLPVNSSYNEYMPFISPDEHFLFFQSDRPDGTAYSGDSDIWMSRRDIRFINEIVFLPPENIGIPVNTPFLEGMSSILFESPNQWHLYFTGVLSNFRDDGVGETDIFYSTYENGAFSKPSSLEEINSLFHDRMPYIVSDGSMLFFTSNRPGGYGGDDIWISKYDIVKSKWRKPYNAGSTINTRYDETSPAIHQNKVSLYFASNRAGGYGGFDIYLAQKKKIPSSSVWMKPENLGKDYNSRYDEEGISLSGDGKHIYFSSNRDQGRGLFDIYQQKLDFKFRSQLSVMFVGKVYIQNTKKGVEANIKISIRGLEHNFSTNLPQGDFAIQLQSNDLYQIQISAPGYEPQEYKLNLRDVVRQNEKRSKNFFLEKVQEKIMVDRNFIMNPQEIMSQDTMANKVISESSHVPKKKSEQEPKKKIEVFYFPVNFTTNENIDGRIEKIYSMWKNDKTKEIIVHGHSGREGKSRNQKEVSRKRALFIQTKLLEIGIPKDKIIHSWYGFDRPVSVEINSASRAKNRRVEVSIR